MRVATAVNVSQPSIARRLEAIQGELEREFNALRSDLEGSSHPKYAELMVVAEKIDFARYCLSCAVRVAHDRRVAILLDGAL
jgi:hypothetical protein